MILKNKTNFISLLIFLVKILEFPYFTLREHIFPQKRFFPKYTNFSENFFETFSSKCRSSKKFWASYNEALCSQTPSLEFLFLLLDNFFFLILVYFKYQRMFFFNFHELASLSLDIKNLPKKDNTKTQKKSFFFLSFWILHVYCAF